MVQVYTMHGISKQKEKSPFLMRNILDYNWVEYFFKSKKHKFSDLDSAINKNQGDVLTVDDGTYASYLTATTAKKNGHMVTIFVNPYNIKYNKPYHFNVLNTCLAITKLEQVKYKERIFQIKTYEEKLAIRTIIKRDLRLLTLENEENAIKKLYDTFELKNQQIPEFLQTITNNEIIEMANMGIRIENHCWTHLLPQNLKVINDHYTKSTDWFVKILDKIPQHIAIPFGQTLPIINEDNYKTFYLADSRLNPGYIGKKIYNRLNIETLL